MVTKESFGFFAFYRQETSYEIVSDGRQEDDQKDNLSLRKRGKGRSLLVVPIESHHKMVYSYGGFPDINGDS